MPYFEKALYEMDESELSATSIQELADRIEKEIQGGLGARPLLSVPHLLSDEASCYYHGYVLAEMGVHQVRAFFMRRDGGIVDNPKVGPTLASAMWEPGNSVPFLELVKKMTGSPLSHDDWVSELRRPIDELLVEERAAYDKSREEAAAGGGSPASVDLDMRVRIVDGDEIIADTDADGGFVSACAKFEAHVKERFAAPA